MDTSSGGFTPPPTEAPPVPGAAPRGPRPGTVFAAALLMFAVAALSLIEAVAAPFNRDSLEKVIEEQGKTPDSQLSTDAINTISTVALLTAVVIAIMTVIVFVVLALLVLRGKNWARITTWVLSGLFLCCGGLGGLSNIAAVFSAEVGGYAVWTTISTILKIMLAIGIIVFLALPPSNAYFRKPSKA
jgi:hypothetical protein